MATYRSNLPQIKSGIFLVYTGMETDLIFKQGVDLPGFASYPLLESDEGRAWLKSYFSNMIEIGTALDCGVILESPTWVANRDRAGEIGYSPKQLRDLNIRAIELMSEVRKNTADLPTLLSGNVGPSDDAYAPSDQMSSKQAEDYHAEQIATLAETEVDLISGHTIAYPAEAIGIVRAANQFDLPVIIAFTVETDGHLPTGTPLSEAIAEVDAATDGYASYFMIICAHPEHFQDVLTGEPWMQRLKGLVVNASRCSHAELDNAEELDSGDPVELGHQLAEIRRMQPQINIVGGCCGTDMRHISQIAKAVQIS